MSDPAAIESMHDDSAISLSLQPAMEAPSLPMPVYESAQRLLRELQLQIPGCILIDPTTAGSSVINFVKRLGMDGHLIPVIAVIRGDSRKTHKHLAETAAIRRRINKLTRRELDLLKLVVSGKANKQIAADLGISIKTVANHRAHLMAKTQALNAADLARMSTSAGLFQS